MHVLHRSSAYLPRVFFEQRDRSRQHRAPFVMDFKPFRPKSDPCNRQYLPYILQRGRGRRTRKYRRQKRETVAPPGFCNRGEVRYGSIGDLEYEVPQSRLYCLCINVALCSTALQCICLVIRRSSMTVKAHTYYIIFGRPFIGGKLSPFPPWRRH